MAYVSIGDFRFGMDRRRERVAGTPGTLWTLENGHITRGGDIERCKKFVSKYTLPATCFGLVSLSKQLWTFGSANLAGSMPLGVNFQRLQSPNSGNMTAIVDVGAFAGKLYVVADYDDGGRFHFYNGSRVTDWDAIADASSSYATLAQFLAEKVGANDAVTAKAIGSVIEVTARTPGVAFTISSATVDHGTHNDQTLTVATPQANVAAVAEVRATATVTVTGGTNGVVDSLVVSGWASILQAPVTWNGSNAATAINIAKQINNLAATTSFTAAVVGNVVTVSGPVGTGASLNSVALVTTTHGDIAVSADPAFSGGVTEVDAVAQVSTATFGGTFEAVDNFTLTINGTDYKATGRASATGRSANVFFQRVWSAVGPLWRYCKLTDATVWDPLASGSDAGFLDVSLEDEGDQNLITAAPYMGQAAVYSETSVILWNLDPDPTNFIRGMTLNNVSTEAAHSVIRYGNNDVFHLDPTGIRSLRALNASNAPFVSDVGNAIDTFVDDWLSGLTESERRGVTTAIEPRDGRLWMAMGGRIYVLSFFPGAKISGWSYYSPGFDVEAFAKIGKQLYAKSGNTIYLYGGDDGQTYPDDDESIVTVELPFLAAGTPATKKDLSGFDAAFLNEWQVDALIDANDESKVIPIGKVRNKTYAGGDIPIGGEAPLMALKMVCSRGGRAAISMAQVHFKKADAG